MRSNINFFLIFLLFCFVSFGFTNCNSPAKNRIEETNLSDEEKIKKTVINFLSWYKANFESINSIVLVPNSMDEDLYNQYRVNKQSVEKYLKIIKSSNLVTDAYIDELRQKINLSSQRMLETKQTDGPPIGLEADLILKTQEVNDSFEMLPDISFKNIDINGNSANVTAILVYELKFYFEKLNNQWMITSR